MTRDHIALCACRFAIVALVPSLVLGACMNDRRIALVRSGDGGGTGGGDGASVGGDGAPGGGQFSEVGSALHFGRVGPGMPLPTEANCAARVRRSTWEPRTGNTPFNQRVPTAAQLTPLSSGMNDTGIDDQLGKRVTGNFTGTTDEILQWGACKWGFDEDYVRAFAVQASNWRQYDSQSWSSDPADCPANPETRSAFGGTECATIYGMFQIAWRYHKTTWPMVHDSTAFNVDYSLGYVRSCFEKLSSWLETTPPAKPYVAGDEWGCVGAYYSGNWYDSSGTTYMTDVRDLFQNHPWTQSNF